MTFVGKLTPIELAPLWALDNRMTVVLFAGMGGGCDGLEAAGFHVHLAVNHDPIAVALHEKRHPHTQHLRCDVFEVDPRTATQGRGVRILHASPDCTHFSVAKGGKPVSKRRRSLAWVVPRWCGQVRPEVVTLENVPEIQTWGPLIAKRDKATGRVMKLDETVAAKGERVPLREQWLIPDPRHKGRIWRAWLKHMEGLGYRFESRVLVCSDYGVRTIRKRLFGVGTADGSPIEWPVRTHAPRAKAKAMGLKPWLGADGCIDWSLPVRSIFGRKKELADATKRRTARGVVRYVVENAKPFIVPITHSGGDNRARGADEPLVTLTTAHRGELAVVAPHIAKYRTGATGSDIGEPMPTVTANSFETRPGGAIPLALVSAHMEKFNQNGDGTMPEEPLGTVMAGAPRHAIVATNLVQLAHGDSGGRRESELGEPLMTVHAGGGNQALVATTLVQTGYGERDGQAPRALDIEEPLGTQVAGGGKAALVAAFMAQHNNDDRRIGGVHPGREAEEPVATLTVNPQVGVVAASLGRMRGADVSGQPVDAPMPTQTSGGGHENLILAFLQTYYSSGGQDQALDSPLHALTAKARHGLVTVKVGRDTFVITDIGMRMLEPEEGAASHGFKHGCLDHVIDVFDAKKGRMVRRKLTKTEKYHLVGNSVPPRMIELLARANVRRELTVAAE